MASPTLMHLLSRSVHRIMDDRVLSEVFTDAAPVGYAKDDGAGVDAKQGFGAEDAEEIEERLRGLGYR